MRTGLFVAWLVACGVVHGVMPRAEAQIANPFDCSRGCTSADPFLTTEYFRSQAARLVNPVEAYRRGYTGAGLAIAVIDDGIDVNNVQFRGRIAPGSLSFAGGTIQHAPGDSHGTEVGGLIAANRDGVGIQGIAYDASVLVYKTNVPTTGVIDAFYAAAASSASIINASIGPGLPLPGETLVQIYDPRPTILNRNEQWFPAVLSALNAGKIIVAAAGNSFDDAPIAARNPFGIGLYPYVTPANANSGVYTDGGRAVDFSAVNAAKGQIVAVVAVNDAKQITFYSNRCGVAASWCISAPGNVSSVNVGGGTTTTISGTSFAAPIVAGALALYMEALPSFQPRDIVRLMFATTEDLGAPGVDEIYGHGLLRIDQTFAALGAMYNPVHADTTLARLGASRQFGSILESRQSQIGFGLPGGTAPLPYASSDNSRIDAVFASAMPSVAPGKNSERQVWSMAHGGRSRVGENAYSGGYRADSFQWAAGVDGQYKRDLNIGFAAGFNRTSLSESLSTGADSRIDSYQAAIYATWTPGPWLVKGSLAAAYADITTQRAQPTQAGSAATARGHTQGFDVATQFDSGYRIPVGRVEVMPHGGLRYEHLARNGFTESGADTFNLTLSSERFDALRSTLGVTLSAAWQLDNGVTLRPSAGIAWRRDLMTMAPQATANFFDSSYAVPAALTGRDAAVIEAGLVGYATERFRLMAQTTAEFRRNAADYRFTGGLAVAF